MRLDKIVVHKYCTIVTKLVFHGCGPAILKLIYVYIRIKQINTSYIMKIRFLISEKEVSNKKGGKLE